MGNIENLPQKIVILVKTPQDNIEHKLFSMGCLTNTIDVRFMVILLKLVL
jgi:hypothetical protein